MFLSTPKQKELFRLITENSMIVAKGGSRSGKTLEFLRYMFLYAYNLEENLIITRKRNIDVNRSLVFGSIPLLFKLSETDFGTKFNSKYGFYEFKNGSHLWLAGTDDKERLEKVLGNEYGVIFHNELSQQNLDMFSTFLTRWNPKNGNPPKMLIDYNPPNMRHFSYPLFEQNKYPNGELFNYDFKSILMNPTDNPHLSANYLKVLASLPESHKRRFLYGDYTANIGALWSSEDIFYNNEINNYHRVVVGIDPAGGGRDEIGIVVAAKTNDTYVVLDDLSMRGKPDEWASRAAYAADKYNADAIVAERNYGGDMVEATIRAHTKKHRIIMTNSSKSKIIRAEPVFALYKQGQMFHKQPFYELENEMCSYTGEGSEESPNRLDAMVFATNELLTGKNYRWTY